MGRNHPQLTSQTLKATRTLVRPRFMVTLKVTGSKIYWSYRSLPLIIFRGFPASGFLRTVDQDRMVTQGSPAGADNCVVAAQDVHPESAQPHPADHTPWFFEVAMNTDEPSVLRIGVIPHFAVYATLVLMFATYCIFTFVTGMPHVVFTFCLNLSMGLFVSLAVISFVYLLLVAVTSFVPKVLEVLAPKSSHRLHTPKVFVLSISEHSGPTQWQLSLLESTSICIGLFTVASGFFIVFYIWILPISFALNLGQIKAPFPQLKGCGNRVDPAQSPLFTPAIYAVRLLDWESYNNSRSFDEIEYLHIKNNHTLCERGFIGNQDLYGLGNRMGLYLQWITAFVVNNTLPYQRKPLRVIYLAYALAVAVATYALTLTGICTFTAEIEVLYWTYWGGFICVFASSPSYTRLSLSIPGKWIGLDWMSGINCTLHVLMLYHGGFYWHYGHDSTFVRMPCGTYHFCLAPMLDPSKVFLILNRIAKFVFTPLWAVLLLLPPVILLALTSEIMSSIRGSPNYKLLASCFTRSIGDKRKTTSAAKLEPVALWLRISRRLQWPLPGVFRVYRWLRNVVGLPPEARDGIRLVTAIDIQQRRWAVEAPKVEA